MSCYHNFTQLEQIVNCDKLNEIMVSLMSYMKLTVDDAEVEENNILDWMAMIDSGDYDDYEIAEDIRNNGSWSDTDLAYIKSSLRDLNGLMGTALNDFFTKTGVRVYFEYNHEEYESYFDFNATSVFDSLLELNRLKINA